MKKGCEERLGWKELQKTNVVCNTENEYVNIIMCISMGVFTNVCMWIALLHVFSRAYVCLCMSEYCLCV